MRLLSSICLLAYCLLVKFVVCFYVCKNILHIWFVLLCSVFKGLLVCLTATFTSYQILNVSSSIFLRKLKFLFLNLFSLLQETTFISYQILNISSSTFLRKLKFLFPTRSLWFKETTVIVYQLVCYLSTVFLLIFQVSGKKSMLFYSFKLWLVCRLAMVPCDK